MSIDQNLTVVLDELEPYHTLKLAKVSLENFIISSQGLKLFCQKLPYLQLHELNLSKSDNMKGSLSMFTLSFPNTENSDIG